MKALPGFTGYFSSFCAFITIPERRTFIKNRLFLIVQVGALLYYPIAGCGGEERRGLNILSGANSCDNSFVSFLRTEPS
jgi:hypothetical protein